MTGYRIAEVPPASITTELNHLMPLTQQLLYRRGITTKAAADAFLDPLYDEQLHDPFLLHDMDVAVVRILRALEAGERIAIFSDYDCDGIPGAVVLHDFLTAVGHENFTTYIPHRHYEGFGMSTDALDTLHNDAVTLVVTIDCGTGNHEAIAHANRLGMDVIVTDHHEPKDTLPEAVAVVNPKVGDTYPFDGLCGAGVIFKVVQATLQKGKENKQLSLTEGWEKWWLDMVGVATIADMVPLVDENRVLARYGISVLRKSRRPGLQHLLRRQRASQRHLTEDDVGFTIGPRINAASRMDTPEDAFFMLAKTDEGEAGAHVAHLEKLNNERRGIVAAMTKEIHKRLEEMTEIPPVLVMGNPEWRPAIVGLSANKLADEYKRPVFLWGRDGNGVIKGSCRSDGKTSVVRLMESITDHLLEYGGHHFSAGFSVADDQIHTLPRALADAYTTLGAAAVVDEEPVVDAVLTLSEVTDELLRSLRALAPFGMDNPKPVFAFTQVRPTAVELFGKGKDHTKLRLTTDGKAHEALAFFKKPDDFTTTPTTDADVTLLAHVEESYFMGRPQVRLRIVDIV